MFDRRHEHERLILPSRSPLLVSGTRNPSISKKNCREMEDTYVMYNKIKT